MGWAHPSTATLGRRAKVLSDRVERLLLQGYHDHQPRGHGFVQQIAVQTAGRLAAGLTRSCITAATQECTASAKWRSRPRWLSKEADSGETNVLLEEVAGIGRLGISRGCVLFFVINTESLDKIMHHQGMAIKGTGSTKFQHTLQTAEDSLWTSFQESRLYAQRGDIGDVREDALAYFLRQRLPQRFAIASGEVVDTQGTQSGQTDILIYDQSETAPLTRGRNVILPAEALLATVEIKSVLSKDEIAKSINGVNTLHTLRPWDAPFGLVNGTKGLVTDSALPRIFTSVFAYNSNLVEDNWAAKELARVRDACGDASMPVPCLDRVAVLNRGLINPASGKALIPGEKGVLGHWFFNLVNFLSREAGRRRPFPWNDYHDPTGREWIPVATYQFDAPPARRATTSERNKARKVRNAALSDADQGSGSPRSAL